MKKIVITGLSGVVGHIVAKTAPQKYLLFDLFHKLPCSDDQFPGKMFHKHIDIVSKESIDRSLSLIHPDVIIHMAAMTHIDACEEDKIYGKDGIVWKVNVDGTNNIAAFGAKNNIPVVYLSTECVFDGKKSSYSETDKKYPKNWYGMTKHEAEEIVLSSGSKATIIRSVIAYHERDLGKTMFGKFVSPLKINKKMSAVGDQLCSMTYTYDIAQAVWNAVERGIYGIFHVTPDIALSPYDFILLGAHQLHFDTKLIKKTTLDSFFGKERAALRLKHSCLSQQYSNSKLHIKPRTPLEVFAGISI